MEIIPQSTGWVLIISFGIIWILLGKYWGKKAKNNEGFMLAGRNVGLALGVTTTVATWVTSNTTMLAPQLALQFGIWGMLAYSTASFGLFLFSPLANRIQKLIPRGFTSGDFIRVRFGKISWYVFLLISFFYSLTWLVSMAMAGGLLMQSLAGINYFYGMSIILLVCVAYTLFGGLFAVIGTDFIQTIIILIGIVVAGFAVLSQVSLTTVYQDLESTRPMLISLLFPAAIMSFFNNMLFGMGEIFHSNVWWSRVFAIKKGHAGRAFKIAGIIWWPIPIAAGFIALSTLSLDIAIPRPDMVGPLVAAKLLGSVGSIVVFIVIFCSLASSVDSLLASTSDLMVRDIFVKIFKLKADEKNLKVLSKFSIIILGVVTWMICLPQKGSLASVLFFAGPLVGSTIWPIIGGLFWQRMNGKTAFLAMSLGSILGLVSYFKFGWYTATLVSAVVSMLITILGTVMSKELYVWKKLQEV